MNRRDFLKVSGILSTATFVAFTAAGSVAHLPIEIQSGDKLYRGTFDGKFLISEDGGKNWQLHTNFGYDLPILNLRSDLSGRVHAQLGFAGHSFELALTKDSKIWKTV